MQVILREPLEKLGTVGDVVEVKPGYARNYLIPRGLAYEATAGNLRQIEREREARDKEETALLSDARRRAKDIDGLSLTFHARAGQEGKLFGSITNADVAERLASEHGIEVDRRQIEMDEPLKSLGVFAVPIRLHGEVKPEVRVWVVQED